MPPLIKEKPSQFEIIDEDERLVKGWASVEVVDLQGDIVPISELKRAMYRFMDRGGLIMYAHSNKPVGKVLQWEVEKYPGTDVYGIRIVAKIFKDYPIDDAVWKAIKNGELKGFSIGAQAKEEKRLIKDANGQTREVGVLHDLNLMEISIVKEPANPLALVEEVNYFAKSLDREALKKEILKKYGVTAPVSLRGCPLCERVKSILKELGHTEEEIADVEFALGVHAAIVEKTRLEKIVKRSERVRKEAQKAFDEWIEVMKPFGKWKNFADCVRDMKERGYSEESAKRICGKLQAELEKQETAGDIEPIDALGRRAKLEEESLIKQLPANVVSLLEAKADALLEKAEDERPPKEWWDYCVKTIKESNPDYTDEQVRRVCGSMWYHRWGLWHSSKNPRR
jgi:hypothetical protein